MEDFVVSALKYRPGTFDTVVGQDSITQTLKNAIRNHHVAKAFLFCGPRGVGKTTSARILAKTLNCFNPTEDIEPCNECDSCNSFNGGHSLNIHELDAASNNSVEDIRNLIDQVRLAPQIGSHKVYIIDEVHMLSQAAFNAFLKTLEEPPEHAIFILATTEKHKVLPTILSRCQIFDFHRIGIRDIAKHLQKIAEKEGIEHEPEGLHLIAQKADGALRDALSIFDQIVSSTGNSVSYQDVISNLNILDHEYFFKVTDHLCSGNISESLLLFNEILHNGFDGHNFINGLAQHFRDLLVCQDPKTLELLETSDQVKAKYKEQSAYCSGEKLVKGLDLTSKADQQYKTSKNQRLLVELTLMQLADLLGDGVVHKEGTGSREQAAGNRQQATGNRQQAVGSRQQGEERGEKGEAKSEKGKGKGEKGNVESKEEKDPPVEESKQPTEKINQEEPEQITQEPETPPTPSTDHPSPSSPQGEGTSTEHQERATMTDEESEDIVEKTDTTPEPSPQPEASQTAGASEQVAETTPENEAQTSNDNPRPQPSAKRQSKGGNGPSINEHLFPQETKEEEGESGSSAVISDDRPRDDFTKEQLLEKWKAFAEKVKEEDGVGNLSGTLTQHEPELKDGHQLEIHLINTVQKNTIEKAKSDLLTYLREQLNNFDIDLKIFIEEQGNAQADPYTPKDQYNRMAEKNPNIKKLKDQFGLNIDY